MEELQAIWECICGNLAFTEKKPHIPCPDCGTLNTQPLAVIQPSGQYQQ